jgi:hypothetical protein
MSKKKPHQESDGAKSQTGNTTSNNLYEYCRIIRCKRKNDHINEQKKAPIKSPMGQRVKQEIQRAIIFMDIVELYVVKAKDDHSNEQKKAIKGRK